MLTNGLFYQAIATRKMDRLSIADCETIEGLVVLESLAGVDQAQLLRWQAKCRANLDPEEFHLRLLIRVDRLLLSSPSPHQHFDGYALDRFNQSSSTCIVSCEFILNKVITH